MRVDSPVAQTMRCSSPDAETLTLSGALTFTTAAQALQEGSRTLAQGAHSRLDLQGVTHADSAGLACVLALLAQASRLEKRLAVANPPDGLRALAEVCDAGALLQT
ncbi:MAG: STAS domain-containing protein [Rhodanobacteraceae bacterium]